MALLWARVALAWRPYNLIELKERSAVKVIYIIMECKKLLRAL